MEVLAGRVIVRPRDHARSRAFYADALGLAVAREFPGGVVFFLGGGYLELSHGGPDPAGGSDPAGGTDPDPGAALGLQVRSLPAEVAGLRERGVPIVRGPHREPWGLDECWIADPDGRAIVLVEVPAGHPIRTDLRR